MNAQDRSVRVKRFNERIKLLVTTFNAFALGVAGSAVVLPVVKGEGLTAFSVIWIIAAIVLHLFAQALIGLIRSED